MHKKYGLSWKGSIPGYAVRCYFPPSQHGKNSSKTTTYMLLQNCLIRPAIQSDVPLITELVHSAYEPYVFALGMKPNPMLDDYREAIATSQVWVLIVSGNLVGVVVLDITNEGFLLSNVALHPSHKGKGFGSLLLEFAEQEAIRSGHQSIYLYTNVAMKENQAIYAARGFVEYARREVNHRAGVFMRKWFDLLANTRTMESTIIVLRPQS